MSATQAAKGGAVLPRRGGGVTGLVRFGADPLKTLDRLREDERALVPFALGPLRLNLVTRPEDIREVLDADWPPLSRGRLMALDRWYSGGLILTAGAEHDRQRDELWEPLVAAAPGARVAAARAARLADAWSAGEPVEVFAALRALCWAIDWELLTGEDMPADVLAAQERGVAAMVWLLGPFGERRWGTPAGARTRAARARLDAAIDAHLAARRAEPREDLLSQLAAREPDDEVVRATVKQWLGADQIGALLTWTLHLLTGDDDARARWREELDAAGDDARLPYAEAVIKEALRLYPPIWGFFRELTSDLRVGEQTVPAGHLLALSPWVTHRDARLWPDPLRFDPGRWAEGAERPPAVSYFPFSAGPYGCPGHGLAMQEAAAILATLGRRLDFAATGPAPRLQALGAIVPRGGLKLQPSPRG